MASIDKSRGLWKVLCCLCSGVICFTVRVVKMASVKEITAELMKTDLYQLLEIEPSADEKAIKKAYRKKALKCHPDKNPGDNKAAELFLKLSKVLEILCDADARKSYDHLLKARAAAALRNRELDSKRKKLKDDLEAREKAAEARQDVVQKDMMKLQAEIERLRKQGSKQLEEEQELMREQLKKESEGHCMDDLDEGTVSRIKIKWKAGASVGEYDEKCLRTTFSKYGDISAVVISKKKKGSALIEFLDPKAAMRACRFEKGVEPNLLTVELVGSPSQKTVASTYPDVRNIAPSVPAMSQAGFDTFENMVLKNMRQAQERKNLTEKKDGEETS